jgi:sugar phosphate isomerase/epimerase
LKISFSTLGCPEWSWDDMVITAKDLGFDGIEIRGIENELYVPKAKPFLDQNIESTKTRLAKLNLEIPCLTSSCYLFEPENINSYMEEGKAYISLASQLNVPYIRVLGDKNPEPGENIDISFVAENLHTLAQVAGGKGVKVLIETNGLFSNSDTMIKLIKDLKSPHVGVLWDIHHPFRYMNESIQKTYDTLKEYILLVHIKDSVCEDGKVRYKMLGHGDLPVKEALNLLNKDHFSGFVSLEWVKRWCIDLEEPGVVFSHFVNYVKGIIE